MAHIYCAVDLMPLFRGISSAIVVARAMDRVVQDFCITNNIIVGDFPVLISRYPNLRRLESAIIVPNLVQCNMKF